MNLRNLRHSCVFDLRNSCVFDFTTSKMVVTRDGLSPVSGSFSIPLAVYRRGHIHGTYESHLACE